MADIDSDLLIPIPSLVISAGTGVAVNILLPSIDVEVDIILLPEVNLAITLPALKMSGETGADGHLPLPVLVLSGSATNALSAELSIKLPRYKLAGITLSASVGNLMLTLPRLSVYATTTVTYTTDLKIPLPTIKVRGSIVFPNANLLITLPNLILQGILYSTSDIPSISSIIDQLTGTQEYRVFRLNLDNAALSTLTYNAVKGHVILGDVEYVGTADGLYSVGGKSFGGYAIEWAIQTPLLDFDLPGNKRLRAVKLGGEFKNVLSVVVSADEDTQHQYATIPVTNKKQDGIQAYVSRKVQGRYLQIGAVGEGKMAIDAMEAMLILTGKRAR